MICDLRAKNIISQDEEKALLERLASQDVLDENAIEEASGLVQEKEQVLEKLMQQVGRNDVGKQENYEPVQPSSEPQAPLSFMNEIISGSVEGTP